jgi:hypothetical protein
MLAVDIFAGIKRGDHRFGVDMPWQRRLHDDAVCRWLRVQRPHMREHARLLDIGRQLGQMKADAYLLTGAANRADIPGRGGIAFDLDHV